MVIPVFLELAKETGTFVHTKDTMIKMSDACKRYHNGRFTTKHKKNISKSITAYWNKRK